MWPTSRSKPVIGASVEICGQPKMMFSHSPCEDAALKLIASTGADGSFMFKDVPVAEYGFAIKDRSGKR